jgi:hypothetical protein
MFDPHVYVYMYVEVCACRNMHVEMCACHNMHVEVCTCHNIHAEIHIRMPSFSPTCQPEGVSNRITLAKVSIVCAKVFQFVIKKLQRRN